MHKINVSIIIPSLNSASYIRQCLNSVIAQSLKMIEIICVDAGSTDGTLEILQEYAEKDSRIRIIGSDRRSYGYQMNLGIDAAVGEYIGIVESDDYVLENMYETLWEVAENHNADFVKSDFYRFTGEDCALKKLLIRLASDQSYYGRPINIRDEKECFKFAMNTWNGIYKKEFLDSNHIRHNETPGASFQDNGFWFQTFMHAKKAVFLDKPFYMNRRDNKDSSIFNKSKSFCICDEYAFIKSLLDEDEQLRTDFSAAYAYTCFNTYRWNLQRIVEQDRAEFAKQFTKELRALRDEGYVDEAWFNREQWETALIMMEYPEGINEWEWLSERGRVSEEIKKYDYTIIYGAGAYGRRALYTFMGNENFVRLVCFAVTEKSDDVMEYEGIPVFQIDELLHHREDALVLVAVSEKYRDEIMNTLRVLQFRNILPTS